MYESRKSKRSIDDDEDFDANDHLYGTPFPPLEDDQNVKNSRNKPQELDQTVRDEQGRRRLHGAFTGGWSAGYFNSVGTKEGWQPSQFVSRKNDRSKQRDHKPEDYMDDEDFSEFGIAPKQVKAKDEFFSTTESFAGFRENLNQKALTSIDEVIKDVISLKSSSIGVKILKRMKKSAIQKLTKENYMNSDKIFPLEFNENDLKSFFLNPKRNLNGIGYKGLTTNVNFSTDARLEQQSKSEFSTVMKDGKKLKISGEAFGYGALNEDEDDGYEAEIYTFDDLSRYDYTIGGNRQQSKTGQLFNSILSETDLMDDFRKSNELNLDHRTNKNTIKVPANWQPCPPIRISTRNTNIKKRKSRWDNQSSEENQINESSSNRSEDKYRKLDATKRAEILGESPFSLEREEIDLKLKKIKEEVTIKSSIKDNEKKGEEEDEVMNKLMKPLTGFFAQKFIQSTDTPLEELKPGLTKIEHLPQSSRPKNDCKEETKSFVGKSNRETYQFHPHKLVCKRFNVPHPYPQFPDVVGILQMNKPKQNPDSFFHQPNLNRIDPQPATKSQQNTLQAKKEEAPEIIEEFKKPDMNLFKAVFDLSDDDDGDDDDDDNLSEIELMEERPQEDNQISLNEKLIEKGSTTPIVGEDSKQIQDVSKLLSTATASSNDTKAPKIVFNKAFIVKKDATSKDTSSSSKDNDTKKSLKHISLFEQDDQLDLGSDDEGINLLEMKKLKKANDDDCLFKSKKRSESFKNSSIEKQDKTIAVKRDDREPRIEKNNEINQIKSSKQIEQTVLIDHDLSDESSNDDSCNLDELVNEIIKSDRSRGDGGLSLHKKKKRKKHKEHKKHKKKKHKSSERSN